MGRSYRDACGLADPRCHGVQCSRIWPSCCHPGSAARSRAWLLGKPLTNYAGEKRKNLVPVHAVLLLLRTAVHFVSIWRGEWSRMV